MRACACVCGCFDIMFVMEIMENNEGSVIMVTGTSAAPGAQLLQEMSSAPPDPIAESCVDKGYAISIFNQYAGSIVNIRAIYMCTMWSLSVCVHVDDTVFVTVELNTWFY